MTALVTTEYNRGQLAVIRANNPDLTNEEFNTLVELAKATGLNLFRKQLSAIVFSKSNPKKRRVAFVIGIDGYRAMADRTGTYLPSDKKPEFERCDPSPVNPAGIVACTCYVKKHAHGAWHEFSATVQWDEFAPVEDEWSQGDDGNRSRTGKKKLADNWAKMPFVMLGKCAEVAALRRGWPDTLAGVYAEEELQRAVADEKTIDLTATEIVEQHFAEERVAKIGGLGIIVDWCDGSALESVPAGAMADRVMAWLREYEHKAALFRDRNKVGLQQFWASNKGDALEVKKKLEAAAAKAPVEEAAA